MWSARPRIRDYLLQRRQKESISIDKIFVLREIFQIRQFRTQNTMTLKKINQSKERTKFSTTSLAKEIDFICVGWRNFKVKTIGMCTCNTVAVV